MYYVQVFSFGVGNPRLSPYPRAWLDRPVSVPRMLDTDWSIPLLKIFLFICVWQIAGLSFECLLGRKLPNTEIDFCTKILEFTRINQLLVEVDL